jgi:hypothetical protein
MCVLPLAAQTIPLDPTKFESSVLQVEMAEFKGKRGVKITEKEGARIGEGTLAVVQGVTLQDGTIELEVAGAPGAKAAAAARGFIGIGFRVQGEKYEYVYLRPTNGRAEDQVRRNHSVQYASHPEFPWQRLRKEFPEKYESYVDLEPAVWTKVRIVVNGAKVRVYVHGAEQPCLIVNDLKLGESGGGVGLWIGPGTDGYFANLKISK